MKILVCIKFVPDLNKMTIPDSLPGRPGEVAGEPPAGRMNRYDEYAIETALRLREKCGAARIEALTVGAREAEAVLRRALGMGVDHGTHIQLADQVFPSPFTIGGLIAAWAQESAYDLVLCGALSEDLMQGQVGPVIAGLLRRPCLTSVHTLDYSMTTGRLSCEREVEGGRHEVLSLPLPAVVSIQSGRHAPRYPALSKLLRANRIPLDIIAAEQLGDSSPRQHVAATQKPLKMREGIILKGNAEEKAHTLASMLHARGRI